MFMVTIPFGLALEECEDIVKPSEVPCLVTHTWELTNELCTSNNITVYDDNFTSLGTRALGISNTDRCQWEFNFTDTGVYHHEDTTTDKGTVNVEGDDMASTGLLIFFSLINIGIFALPFFANFVENEAWNKFIGKVVWVFGLFVLTINITMAGDIARLAGLTSVSELIFGTYFWILVRGLYVVMLAIMYMAILQLLKDINKGQEERRMGNAQ